MIEFVITADRSEGVVTIEAEVPDDDTISFELDVPTALFLARRLLEEIGTFEGLSR